MRSFDLQRYGRAFLSIDIKPADDTTMRPIDFKVDTGADYTTISKVILTRIGYDMDWIKQNAVAFEDKDKPTTADGTKVNAGYIQLPLINILGYEGKQWPFRIIIDEDKDFRNLLGRDLLTGLFNPEYPFLPNQEINEVAL